MLLPIMMKLSSSARQSTDIVEGELDVLEIRARTENTAAILKEKDQDPNRTGWDGIISSSTDIEMQINPTEHSSHVRFETKNWCANPAFPPSLFLGYPRAPHPNLRNLAESYESESGRESAWM